MFHCNELRSSGYNYIASQEKGEPAMMTEEEEERSWSDLPLEMLELILSGLPCSDYPHFAAVCKNWRNAAPVVYPVNRTPLLLYYRTFASGICHYFSPSFNKTFRVDGPRDLSSFAFFSGRDGWLLVYNNLEILLLNPLGGISHPFPGLPERTFFGGAAFSGCPPDNCAIFLIDGTEEEVAFINVYDRTGWRATACYANNAPFVLASFSNPECCGGSFYCLGKAGNLGVYDLARHSWTVVECRFRQFDCSLASGHLVESGGELMSIHIGNYGESIRIFRLDRMHMIWEEVRHLGDQSLFTGSKTSLLTTPAEEALRKKAFVPRFHGEPEVISAEAEQSNGQLYFKPKTTSSCHHQSEQGDEAEMCCYSLAGGEHSEYFGSWEKLYSIWFDTRNL